MANGRIVADISVAWWLPLWLRCLVFVAMCMGMTPNPDKVSRMAKRAIRVRFGYQPVSGSGAVKAPPKCP